MNRLFKLKKWGDSLGIIIPKDIVKSLKLSEGKIVDLDINNISDESESQYICSFCKHQFISKSTQRFCPNCDNENKNNLIEVKSGN